MPAKGFQVIAIEAKRHKKSAPQKQVRIDHNTTILSVRKKNDTETFAYEVVAGLENNERIITKKFKTIKIFTYLNYIFPLLADFFVKKFTNINDINR